MGYKVVSHTDNIGVIFSEQNILSLEDYWTEARLAQATPIHIELPNPSPISSKDAFSGEFTGSANLASISKDPFQTGGKLFFTRNGEDRVASAEFCESKNLLLTAAHCLQDMETGEWSENIIFQRGYDSGSKKQKVSIKASAVKVYWSETKQYCWDYGFAITTTESSVEPLKGLCSISTGKATSFGYPSNYYSGKRMVYYDLDIEESSTAIVRMSGNDMGSGCSGGAWVQYGTTNAISVNSFSYTSSPEDQYGPMFTEDYSSLVTFAKTLI
ncbi:MAG: hypothetical protein R3Y11_12120 [Pseudomonadota bacterium]